MARTRCCYYWIITVLATVSIYIFRTATIAADHFNSKLQSSGGMEFNTIIIVAPCKIYIGSMARTRCCYYWILAVLATVSIYIFRNAKLVAEHYNFLHLKLPNSGFQPNDMWFACSIVSIIWAVPDLCLVYGIGSGLEYSNSNPMQQIKQKSIDVRLWEYWNQYWIGLCVCC